MMQKLFLKLCSIILTIVMVVNMLPMTVWAEEYQQMSSTNSKDLSAESTQIQTNSDAIAEAKILGEVVESRTEYSKEFRLDNGLIVAAVYTNPVHYQDNGEWKDIDNTLVVASDGMLTNTAGVWDVSFPQQLSKNNPVTITKDGHTLSFVMAGELRNQGGFEVMSAGEEMETTSVASTGETASVEGLNGIIELDTAETESITINGVAQNFAISSAKISTGAVQTIDLTEAKEAAQYEELVTEKNSSQLLYNNVYTNTDVRYDLQGNKVKESIIMNSYDSNLRGYRYILNVGDMIPVLYSDGGIEFYDAKHENLVMYMPAPYLVDGAQEYSYDIQVNLSGGDGIYTLTYILPSSWLASNDRAWPVVLDPAVTATANVLNIRDHTVAENGTYSYLREVLECGYGPSSHKQWIFLKYRTLPALDASDVILEAKVSLYKPTNASIEVPVNVHKVLGTWESETLTWNNKPKYDTTIEDYAIVVGSGRYYWDITDIARGWYSNALGNTGMMFKAADAYEDGTNTNTWKQFASADNGAASWLPSLTLVYQDSTGLEDYWDYTSASAGRAGSGYVNSYTGNMVWVRDDIGFTGNLMPVTITHFYNLSDASSNDFGLGYGWRTNFNQRITSTYINGDKYYIWEDADGTRHYFWNESYGVFQDEDNISMTLKSVNVASNTGVTGGQYSITDKTGSISVFDSNGRLICQRNNQKRKSSIFIEYMSQTSAMIKEITDGAGRIYSFAYDNNLLSQISFYGTSKDNGVLAYIKFFYTNDNLTSVKYEDGNTCSYVYNSDGTIGTSDDHILCLARDIDGNMLQYSYYDPTEDFQPYRVNQVTELYYDEANDETYEGGSLSYEYSHNQTTFTDHNGNVEIMQFNNYGNTISIQDGEGHAQHKDYAINNTNETGKANQLTLSSRLQNTVVNLLENSSFDGANTWEKESGYSNPSIVATQAYLGSNSLSITNATEIKSEAIEIPSGETYTFSAYVKTGSNNTAKITLHDGQAAYASTVLGSNSDWTRLETSYTNTGNSAVELTARLVTTGNGTTYMDCVQLEQAATASRYNLVQNGDFRAEGESAWSSSAGRTTLTSAASQLSNNVYQMIGDPTRENRIYQTLSVSGNKGDNFVLAGWAKGDSAPLPKAKTGENQRQFALIGTFMYSDGSASEKFIAQFNPDTNAAESWQYVAEVMVATKAYTGVKVEIAYDYNVNTVYFDGIQLFKEQFGNRYFYDDDGNVTSVQDTEGQETRYEYANNNLTKEVLPTGVELTYTYDNYHNVTEARSSDGQIYKFAYDDYGNSTSVSITSNGITMTSSATYSDDGNLQKTTTDAAGNVTTYTYDSNTGLLEKVQYPGGDNSYTEIAYDKMNRIIGSVSPSNSEQVPMVTYAYANDQLGRILVDGTLFSFDYGTFGLLDSVYLTSTWELANYDYTPEQKENETEEEYEIRRRNNYLDTLAYGNEDRVQYEYDKQGRILSQTYEDGDTITYQYDNDGALAALTDSDTGLTTKYYYDFSGSTGATEVRKDANLILRVSELFDNKNRLNSQNITFANSGYKNIYTYNDNNTLSGLVLGRTAGSETGGLAQLSYDYDDFLRLESRTSGINSIEYTFRTVGTNQTTTQITKQEYTQLDNDYSFDYTYDARGNIATYTAPGKEEIEYTYDSNNQLTKAEGSSGYIYSYTYGYNGNITQAIKNGQTYSYTYGNDTWGDLLTAYGGNSIIYDAIGNPTKYYNNWNFTWEHGRELSAATKGSNTLSFKYDAEGLRTTKKVNGVEHTYYYASGVLLRETYSGNTLDFFYDAKGVPYMLKHNEDLYYYITNAQGDVIQLVNSNGTPVAEYEYDPYGATVDIDGSMATVNPLRYRGYYYDSETGLYYLQSRYYDPNIGRFINADDVSVLDGSNAHIFENNLFAYCFNDPINMTDNNGYWPDWATKLIVGTVVIAAAAVLTVATAGTGTALACFAVGALKGAAVGAAVGAASGAVTGAVTHRVTTGSWDGAGQAALEGAADGYMSGAITGFISGGLTSNSCFVAGTAVLASVGYVAIETIQAGDYVWATNPDTGETAIKEVVQTFVNEATELVHVTVNGEEIVCTNEHPFYSPVKGWTAACKLRAGDILVTVNGEYVVVEKIQHEILECPVKVYNFEVEDFHTYYVGDTSVLVHNLCVKQSNPGASGQNHHPISRTIEKAAGKNPNLKGVVTRKSWGTIQAKTRLDHLGYQEWHRRFDKETIKFINDNLSATLDDFVGFMNKLYGSDEAVKKFGEVIFSAL